MLNSSIEIQQTEIRLNDFVLLHIQRDGIAHVVDNYIPIREQYYIGKTNQQNHQWKENHDV